MCIYLSYICRDCCHRVSQNYFLRYRQIVWRSANSSPAWIHQRSWSPLRNLKLNCVSLIPPKHIFPFNSCPSWLGPVLPNPNYSFSLSFSNFLQHVSNLELMLRRKIYFWELEFLDFVTWISAGFREFLSLNLWIAIGVWRSSSFSERKHFSISAHYCCFDWYIV